MGANLFGFSERLPDLRERVRRFVEDEAIPRERPELAHDVAALDAAIGELRGKARAAGIYAPQLPPELGGLALSWRDRSAILEEAGRSFLGAGALNCAPPDQPNMINLLHDGTPAQQAKYLVPARARRDPLLLRDDRARAGRGIGPGRCCARRPSAAATAG